jgi:PIN domain nuclease of toxin-antitoxin system
MVLDASAVLAFLQGERGHEQVAEALLAQPCVVCAANQAEIVAKSLDRGLGLESLHSVIAELGYEVVAVLPEDGVLAGELRPATRHLGLSLGDRLCLAVALRLQAPVLTADRPWLTLSAPLGMTIHCVRPEAL